MEFCLQKPQSHSVGLNCKLQQEGNVLAQMREKDNRAGRIHSELKRDYFQRMSMKCVAMVGSKLIQCH